MLVYYACIILLGCNTWGLNEGVNIWRFSPYNINQCVVHQKLFLLNKFNLYCPYVGSTWFCLPHHYNTLAIGAPIRT